MKVAIVGCGGLGNAHASSYASIPGVTVVGVCDVVEEMANRTAERVGAKAYVSFRDMLEQSGCEVVSITVPSYLHKELAVQAAEAGKHVISEKPIALTLEDARTMIETCKKNGVRLFVGHVVRYFPEYAQIKQQIDSGKIGKLGVTHAKRVGGHPGEIRTWYLDESKSGGVILDLMIHDIDFVRWAGGEVRSVFGLRSQSELLDYATATLVFESGAVANLEAQWGYPGAFTTAAEFAGTGGIIRCDSSKSKSLQVRKTAAATGGRQFVEVPQSPGYESPTVTELRDFIECIRDNREPVVSAEDAYKALEIGLAAIESARTGKAVVIGQETQEVSSR